jgi:mannose-1-phosphate guanylyltransferase
MKFILMAGGQGTKLWPLSTPEKPKQFQKIYKNKTLFRENLEVLLEKFKPEDIIISTKEQFAPYIEEQANEIPARNIVLEPKSKKNQGPGTILAVLRIFDLYGDQQFMLIQTDCLRFPKDKYLNSIKLVQKFSETNHCLTTGGIKATSVDMGVDYIKIDPKSENKNFYKVTEFVPRLNDFFKTKNLIQEFQVIAHTNHYSWTTKKFLDSLVANQNWHQQAQEYLKNPKKYGDRKNLETWYEQFVAGPIENVLSKELETSGFVFVLPYKWVDFGTWNSVYEFFKDSNLNYFDANVIEHKSSRNMVKSTSKKKIVMLGVEDLVVVETDNHLLITKREISNEVGEIAKNLNNENN